MSGTDSGHQRAVRFSHDGEAKPSSSAVSVTSSHGFRMSPRPGGYLKTLVSPQGISDPDTPRQPGQESNRERLFRAFREMPSLAEIRLQKETETNMCCCSTRNLTCKDHTSKHRCNCSSPMLNRRPSSKGSSMSSMSFGRDCCQGGGKMAWPGVSEEMKKWDGSSMSQEVSSVLSVAISTVMMLSKGHKKPNAHMQWTTYFLHQIKDDTGKWALEFLKTIHTPRGDHPKDVHVAIQAIEDRLIEHYAGMGRALSTKDGPATESKEPKPQRPPSDTAVFSSPSATSNTADSSAGSTVKDGAAVQKDDHISVTYDEMVSRSPGSVQQLFLAGSNAATTAEATTTAAATTTTTKPTPATASSTERAPTAGAASKDDDGDEACVVHSTVSVAEMMMFLKDWRHEQVDRIQLELKRLHAIEKIMGSMDTENFEPFVKDAVAKRLKEIEKDPKA